MRTLDVAVVGAGPAGLYAALLLAEEGFDVGVLEEHAAVGAPAHCTGVISDEVSDLFKVPDSLILNRPSACAVVSPSGRAVRIDGGDEEIAVIDRAQFDAELGLAALRAGAEIRTGFRVDRVSIGPGRVVATSAHGVGVAARVCLLASGVNYALQRQLGLGLPTMFLHSAQLEVDAVDAPAVVELHLGRETAPEGFAWVVPVRRDGRARLRIGRDGARGRRGPSRPLPPPRRGGGTTRGPTGRGHAAAPAAGPARQDVCRARARRGRCGRPDQADHGRRDLLQPALGTARGGDARPGLAPRPASARPRSSSTSAGGRRGSIRTLGSRAI